MNDTINMYKRCFQLLGVEIMFVHLIILHCKVLSGYETLAFRKLFSDVGYYYNRLVILNIVFCEGAGSNVWFLIRIAQ